MKHPHNQVRYLLVNLAGLPQAIAYDDETIDAGFTGNEPRVCVFDDPNGLQSYRFGTLAEARKLKKELAVQFGDHYVIVRALDLDRRRPNHSRMKVTK